MCSWEYQKICGRWSGKTYTLVKKLGAGGIGEIYLVTDEQGRSFAMKISRDLVGLTKEYGSLGKFSHLYFVPRVYELDDFQMDGKLYHFFIMEYINGYTLREAVSQGKLSFGGKLDIARVIADILKGINDQGYVYTDLKLENIMVDRNNNLIRLIDFGSITPIGERVREYTSMYDRSSWNAGSMRADKAYQVFSLAMLLISMLLMKNVNPGRESLAAVMGRLRKRGYPKALLDTIEECLKGKITDCGSLYNALGGIRRRGSAGRKLTYALDAVIAFLTVMLAVLIRTVFA